MQKHLYLVTSCPFNAVWAPDLIGHAFIVAPSYLAVERVHPADARVAFAHRRASDARPNHAC